MNGQKDGVTNWKIVGKEVHTEENIQTSIYKIEPNGDLTKMAWIKDGKRLETQKEEQQTFKKL